MKYTDALGNEIKKGLFYGYTPSSSGIQQNRRILITEFAETEDYGRTRLKVRGFAVDDGMMVYGGQDRKEEDIKIGTIKKVTIENFKCLWPISGEDSKKDACCQALLEYK